MDVHYLIRALEAANTETLHFGYREALDWLHAYVVANLEEIDKMLDDEELDR